MRWPWQRDRSEPGLQASAPELEAHQADRPPVPPAGWAFLPPLQRVIGTMELAHGPDRFAGSLAAWANPSFTGPMSHLVTADAPPGVIDVDGGGTGTGEAYRSEPADLTLLIPPARPRPAGGLPTAVQRTASAADAPYEAPSVTASPDDDGVLHVEAVPTPTAVQTPPTDFRPASEPGILATRRPGPQMPVHPAVLVQRSADAESSPRQPQPTQPVHDDLSAQTAIPEGNPEVSDSGEGRAADEPAAEWDAPAWHESGWDTVAPTRPDSVGSTSDGNATYVPLPDPPTVQRATDRGPDSPPAHREAPPFIYPSRLGLGRPLSFSQPAPSEHPVPRASDVAEPHWPVQRAEAPLAPAGTVPPPSAANLASASGQGAVAGSGAGVATPPESAPAVSRTFLESPAAETTEAVNGSQNGATARDDQGTAEQQPLPPAGESSAPLLSDPMPSAPTPGVSGMEGNTFHSSTERGPDLPVVSRLKADKNPENDGGPTLRETAASLLQPDDPHHEISADNSGPAAGARGPDLPSTSAADETSVLSRDERADGFPAQSGVPVHAGSVRGGIAVQRDNGHGWPAVTGAFPIPESPAIAGRGPGANGTPRAGTGAMQGLESADPTQSDALSGATIQRADQAAGDTVAPWSASRAGTADMRASRPVTPGSTPRTWQRMTAMPPAVQQLPAGDTPPAFQTGAGAAASMALGGDTPGRTGADRAADATGGGGPSRMSTDFPPDAGTGHQTGPALETEPDYGGGPDLREVTERPASSAAVGSVIQRTLTLDTPAAHAPDGPPAPGMPFHGTPARNRTPDTVAPALQRLAALRGSVPVSATRYPVAPDLPGPAGQPVVHSAAQNPVVLTLAPAAEPVVDGLGNPGQAFNGAVQRDGLPGTPDAAAPPEAAPAPAPPEVSSAAETDRHESPAGPAPAAPERSAGASGPPSAPTPDQLEELAKRLAGPLIRRIKAEMLLDRERRGLRTDPN